MTLREPEAYRRLCEHLRQDNTRVWTDHIASLRRGQTSQSGAQAVEPWVCPERGDDGSSQWWFGARHTSQMPHL